MKRCPSCDQEMMEHEKVCTNCGYTFASETLSDTLSKHKKPKRILSIVAIVISLVFFGLRIYHRFDRYKGTKKETTVSEVASFLDVAAKYPGQLDVIQPYYDDLVQLKETYHQIDGESQVEEDEYFFVDGQLQRAWLDTSILYQDIYFYIWYDYDVNEDRCKKVVRMSVDYGLNEKEIEAYCEIIGFNNNMVKKVTNDFIELHPAMSSEEEKYEFDDGTLHMIVSANSLVYTFTTIFPIS